jgi:cytochrome c peroxidase
LKGVKQVVDFHNTRDALPVCSTQQVETLDPAAYGSFDPDGAGPLTAGMCWPPAESPQNVNTEQLGNLRLTEAEVDAIVAFLKARQDL